MTDVGDLGTGLTGLSVGPDGAMWAVQAEGRDYPDYYTVDTTTAALRLESVSSDLGSMSGFSWWRGELLAWSESGDILGTVDPATGVWTSTGISKKSCQIKSRLFLRAALISFMTLWAAPMPNQACVP